MSTIHDMLRRFQSINTDEVAAIALDETEPDFVEQQQNQLYEGKLSDGQDITPYYTPLTIYFKEEKSRLTGIDYPTDRVTLLDEGNFYKGLYEEVQGDILNIGSHDSKEAELKAKYDKEGTLFGLGGEFKATYINEALRPEFKLQIVKRLKIGKG